MAALHPQNPPYTLHPRATAPGLQTLVHPAHKLTLQHLQLTHPRMRRHRHEQRTVHRYRTRRSDRGNLLAHQLRPLRQHTGLLHALRDTRLTNHGSQNIANRRGTPSARLAHGASIGITPLTPARGSLGISSPSRTSMRSSLVNSSAMSASRGTARSTCPRPDLPRSFTIRSARLASSSAKGPSGS